MFTKFLLQYTITYCIYRASLKDSLFIEDLLGASFCAENQEFSNKHRISDCMDFHFKHFQLLDD